MRFFLLTLAAISLVTTGCRTDPYLDAYIETVNLEKLALEDRLYELEYDYERLLEERQSCTCGKPHPHSASEHRTTIQSLTPHSIESRSSEATPIEDAPAPLANGGSGEGPEIQFGNEPHPADTSAPKVDLNSSPIDENAAPAPPFDTTPPASNPPANLPAPKIDPDGGPTIQFDARNSTRAKSIQLDRRYTGPDGEKSDARPEYLRLVIQPRDSKRQFLPAAGNLAVVALDAESKEEIARWDVDAADVSELLNRNSDPRGIDFRVPWPAEASSSKRVRLEATFKTADGRELTANDEFTVPRVARIDDSWKPRVLQAAVSPKSKSKRESRTAFREVESPSKSIERASAESRIKRRLQRPEWKPTR